MTTAARSARLVAILGLLVLALPARSAHAQFTYETVHEFAPGPGVVMGNLVQAIDGNLYGVASEGGAYNRGTLFVMRRTADGWGPAVTVHDFRGTDGSRPLGGLIEGTPGVLYGTTSAGGSRGGGTVFRITVAGGFQVLASFEPVVHGHNSIAELTRGPDGSYYGTLELGGRYGYGAVFRMSPTGVLSILHAFAGADGASPRAALAFGLDGRLYSTTTFGGPFNAGTIFRVSTTGAFTMLHPDGGYRPISRMTAGSDGAFYWTTLFRNGPTGPIPSKIMKWTATRGVETVYSFAQGVANNGLVRGPDGLLYGATSSWFGVYRFKPDASEVEWLVTPNPTPMTDIGETVRAPLAVASDATLIGATFDGGLGNRGAVWSISPAGVIRALHNFRTEGGYHPTGSLASESGVLFGTTYSGGPWGFGTVFARHPGSTMEVIAAIPSGMGNMVGGLVVTNDGDSLTEDPIIGSTTASLVSITAEGQIRQTAGPATCTPILVHGYTYWGDNVAIYRMELFSETIEQLHGLEWQSGQPYPTVTALATADDGLLYGTTKAGGAFGHGTIFRLAPDGTGFVTLHNFSLSDGKAPIGNLERGFDGHVYGTTMLGGNLTTSPEGLGTIFRMTSDGTFTLLHAFSPGEGAYPYAGVRAYSDGTLFGTTMAGGLGNGTVFTLDPNGTFTTIHSFSTGQGAVPLGGLTGAFDGAFYGTTVYGGRANAGVIYRLRATP